MEPHRYWLRLKDTKRYNKDLVWCELRFNLNLTEGLDTDEGTIPL